MDCGNSNKIPFHWAKSTIIITILVFLILLCAAIRLAYIYVNIKKIILFGVIFSPFICSFLYLPLYLHINNCFLIIQRIKGKIKIPIADIKSISKIGKSEIHSCIRIWGSGGLFGYLGIYSNPKFGKFNMYATELSNLYLIKTRNKTYIISCKDINIKSLINSQCNENNFFKE
ncbi:PH domain-containing protein [Alistipes sp.]|uniref:PH domain-containing protein n=1 Tax=Alistipes sp. TaxID=1872444 RepID=UPI0033905CB6